MPGFVTTPLTRYIKGPHTITPKRCADQALTDLGKKQRTHGDFRHVITGELFKPRVILLLILFIMFGGKRKKKGGKGKTKEGKKEEKK